MTESSSDNKLILLKRLFTLTKRLERFQDKDDEFIHSMVIQEDKRIITEATSIEDYFARLISKIGKLERVIKLEEKEKMQKKHKTQEMHAMQQMISRQRAHQDMAKTMHMERMQNSHDQKEKYPENMSYRGHYPETVGYIEYHDGKKMAEKMALDRNILYKKADVPPSKLRNTVPGKESAIYREAYVPPEMMHAMHKDGMYGHEGGMRKRSTVMYIKEQTKKKRENGYETNEMRVQEAEKQKELRDEKICAAADKKKWKNAKSEEGKRPCGTQPAEETEEMIREKMETVIADTENIDKLKPGTRKPHEKQRIAIEIGKITPIVSNTEEKLQSISETDGQISERWKNLKEIFVHQKHRLVNDGEFVLTAGELVYLAREIEKCSRQIGTMWEKHMQTVRLADKNFRKICFSMAKNIFVVKKKVNPDFCLDLSEEQI